MTPMTMTAGEIRERLDPALEAFEESARHAQRAIRHAQHTAEDAMTDVALRVRRHPLQAIGIAAGGGLLAGCLIGYALGLFRNGRTRD